jgi:hypothetical protein
MSTTSKTQRKRTKGEPGVTPDLVANRTEAPDAIKMPGFKMQCNKESTGGAGSCTKASCKYLYQAQVDKFGAAAIAALPRDRDDRFARRKARGS